MYENWKFVKLNEKKDGATDWPNKDVEAQSDSNRALCDTQTSSWQEIIYLPQNRESECLGHCVVTKTDLGHYVHKKHMNLVPRTLPRVWSWEQSLPYAQDRNKRRSYKKV